MISLQDEPIQILHVDDDPSVTDLTATFLERDNNQFAVQTATSADEGLELIGDRPPDCIVSDYNMPRMDGLEFLRAVRKECPDLPFILFTGKGSETVASDAIAAGVTDYIQKGGGTEQYDLLANRIRNAVESRREATRAAKQEQLMRLTEVTADTGGFEIDLDSDEVLLTEGAHRIAGLSEETNLTLEDAIGFYYPDDQAALREMVTQVAETGDQAEGVFRFQRPDGEDRLVEMTLTPATDAAEDSLLRGVVNDVTEQNQRERDLERERRVTDQALDALNDTFYVLNTDGSFRRWNSKVPETTGYTDQQLADMDAVELFPPDEHEAIATAIETVLTEGQATVEADLRTAAGDRVPYEFTGARLTDTEGRTTGLVGIGRDQSERHNSAGDVELSQEIVRHLGEGAYVLDAACEFQFVSYRVDDIEGLSAQDWTGRHVSYLADEGILSTREVGKIQDGVDRLLTGETESLTIDVEPELPASTDLAALTLTPLDVGTDDLVLVTTRDITASKQRGQELRRLTQQYRTLVEHFPDGAVYLIDQDLEYVQAAGQELRDAGLEPTDVEGKTAHDLFPEEIADEHHHHYQQALNGTASTFEQTYNGERYRVQTVPVRSEDEAVTHVMAVARNITEYAEHRRELERQNEQLEEFASIVSHDLRNPLSVADGHLELACDATQSEHLEKASTAIDRCQALVEDLLTVAREGDQVEEPTPVALDEVAEQCWETAETGAATVRVTATQPIEADGSRLRQLLENLYRNAVEHGGDEVTVSVGEMDDGFYLADDGAGIPEAAREEVFEAGYSTADEGTGFGLRIVEEVAHAHGWEVAVTESAQGGARFEVTGVERAE
jgi:PAS domain S-box-containing protein